jgi:signal transduction histidine kinase
VAGGGQFVITFRDTGIGIDAGFVPRLFARFEQADRSTTRSFDGLGLGLAIVRHIVELHGGTVNAASDGPGRGATFTVTMPLWIRGAEEAKTGARAS